jgi:hypothetical protein
MSFNNNYLHREQISIFKDHFNEPRQSEDSRIDQNPLVRIPPSEQSLCTIRIRTKSNMETFKGSVKRTISEHRATGQQKSKLKDAKKRLKTLEKLENFRKEKMSEEIKHLEIQNKLYVEHRKIEKQKENNKRKYFEKRRKQLEEGQQKKKQQMGKEERKKVKEEKLKKKIEDKKKQYYDDQKLKLN